jgi:predicted phage baseplate assembly protein
VPLVPPTLDDRTFDDLYAEARLRAARYNSGWTDFNESDPGVTLLQLFAWLTEQMLYRLNQVPERNYLKFLQLLDFELRPAQAALAYLTFSVTKKEAEVKTIPASTRVAAQPPSGGNPLIFETEDALDVITLPLSDIQIFDGVAFTPVGRSNVPTNQPLAPFGPSPHTGNALYLGFDPPQSIVDPANPNPGQRVFPAIMRFRVFLTTATLAARANVCRVGDPPAPPVGVSLVWEYKRQDGPDWTPLKSTDMTSAFTREGDILVEGPAAAAATVEGKQELGPDGRPMKHVWLRVRIAQGTYHTGHSPEIDFIRPNTVAARNLTTVGFEQVGTSTGRPNQSFTLANTPVFPDTLQLAVESKGITTVWTRVDDFLSAGRDDKSYTVNLATGEITFGDGQRGAVPDPGAVITAVSYRYGGGSGGNVAAGLINQPLTDLGNIQVKNERAAVGGRDEQTVDELKDEAPARLRCRRRAVTAEDYQALAEEAGGVARAVALPLAHPDFPYPQVKIPGTITVVIVPDTDDPAPVPSQDEIICVGQYLDQFRLITTEVYVKKPSYCHVQVMATIRINPTASANQVTQAVEDAINTHLDPLGRVWVQTVPHYPAPGEPTPPPFAFGQSFFPTRLYGVILGVKDVVDVTGLQVTVSGFVVPLDKAVKLPSDGLVYGSGHTINVSLGGDSSTQPTCHCS